VWQANFGAESSVPGAFVITGPTGVQNVKDIHITWGVSAGATSYRISVSREADLSLPLFEEIVTATEADVFLHNGTYYIGVAAINDSGETLASNNGVSFTIELPETDQLIFVSSLTYFINTTNAYPPNANSFGSTLAADYQCNNLANSAGLHAELWDFQTIHFRALVTQDVTGLIARVGLVDDTYYNVSGDIVANNRADLLAGNFSAPIKTQNNVTLVGVHGVWTGANSDATASANKCSNWGSTTGTARGGNVNGIGTNWLNQGAINCNTSVKLYCVGDRVTPP
jgi:hypothetical protein